ncbi:MAG: flagellar biosynthesis protein FlhB [Clostridiales bacterium]|jgi:flagellar biosynthetic protein FlhB|nr:flagellar biosynthesis protein FlhB [Clostridiales bacterium]
MRGIVRLNLGFFAEGGEKTERATPRKKQKARDEGQVAQSQEINTAFTFLGVFAVLKITAGWIYQRMLEIFSFGFGMIGDMEAVFSPEYSGRVVTFFLGRALWAAAPVMLSALFIGIISNVIQVGWKMTPKALRPKFSRLNPVPGFKRMFSPQTLVTLLKSILKFSIIAAVIYSALRDELNNLPKLAQMALFESVAWLGELIVNLGLNVGGWFIFVAAADYAFTRFRHTRELRMTKQEVKEEFKQTEGNPQIKGRIRSKMREVSTRRMMQEVPHADVIITNPTHYAVALAYDRDSGRAPLVTAKGVGYAARRIKEIARKNGVEIVENRDLARVLYATVDTGEEIPPEMYQAAAEILAFVYRLKKMA